MSNNDDFLRDFFKNQHFNSDDISDENNKNSSETERNERNEKSEKNKKSEKSIREEAPHATRYSSSKKFASAKEINLRKLFEGIEKEKNKYRKKRKEISKLSYLETPSTPFPQQFIEDIENIEYKKIRKKLKEMQKKYEHQFVHILKEKQKKQEIKQEKLSQKSISSLGNIKTFDAIEKKKIDKKLKKIPSFTAIPKKQEKQSFTYSHSSPQSFIVHSVEVGEKIKYKKINEENEEIKVKSVTPFSHFFSHENISENKEEIKSEIKPDEIQERNKNNEENKKNEGSEEIDKKLEKLEKIEKTEIIKEKRKNIFKVSRTGKKYIPDIWESHPERIPHFEIHSLSSADEKIEIDNIKQQKSHKSKKIQKTLFSAIDNFLETLPKTIENILQTGKTKVEKGRIKTLKIVKTTTKVTTDHAKKLQREWDLYKEMISSVHHKSKKLLKKGDEQIAKVHVHEKKFIENWKEKQQQTVEKRAVEKLQIEKKKREEKQIREQELQERKLQEKKLQELQRFEREKAEKIREKKELEQQEKKKLAIEKLQQEEQEALQIPQFSQKKGKIKISFLPTKAEVKEWAQIAGMVASVFVVGVVGLRLPGLMSQYESVLNADFFNEQQESVSFLLDTKENPFKNIKSLPVAGNVSVQKKINNNEFLNINPPDTRIVIPKIAKNIPILEIGDDSRLAENWEKLESDIQDALRDGVVHYPGTALPGDDGNVFITGHSSYYPWDKGRYKDVFAALHNLEVGDEYYIFHKGKKYKYIITTRKIVPPSDVSVLDQDRSKKESTLMTCTPVGTAKNRLILKAKEVSIEY